jgi:plastocyanin
MHTIALQLAPVLAAEKSKVPFYVAGGILVAWALTLSLGIGLRKPDFPSSLAGQRAVMGISLVLVLAAVSTAVVTSSVPAKGSTTPTKTQELPPVPVVSAPVAAAGASSTSSTSGASSEPTATTGTPAPASSPAAGKAGSSLALAADPAGALAYNTKQLSAKAGTVTITMTNMSPLEHNVTVAEGTKVLGATPTFKGASMKLTLKLKPGRYVFYCSVPGHRQAGMEGTLNVS